MKRSLEDKESWDWWLILIVFGLIILGIVNLYSAAYSSEHPFILDIRALYGKQAMWVGIGTFLGIVIALIDAEYIRKLTPYAFGFVTILLILVLFTEPINGARSWLGIGPFGIQPSEFAKLTTGLIIAYFLSQGRVKNVSKQTVYFVLFLLFATMFLVLFQNDTGTFLVFTAFFFVMYREGITFDPIILFFLNSIFGMRLKKTWLGVHFIPFLFVIIFFGIITLYFSESVHSFAFLPETDIPGYALLITILTVICTLIMVLIKQFASRRSIKKLFGITIITYVASLIIVGSVSYTYLNILQSHQRIRIDLWLGKVEDKDGEDYNRNRALAAVGSGGFRGNGYQQAILSSPESQHVPESETDFIFCVYAEEWGFLGSLLLVFLYTTLFIRIVVIAERQKSKFARVYAYSVVMILFYHFAINIGMNIGVLPVIGIPLPFVSYGGSSIMAFLIMIFILLKLDSQRKNVLA
jgi:rod shape determining protein RodA